jgi:hypothetical protein
VRAALSRGSFGQRGAAILRPSLPHLCLWLRLTFSPDSPNGATLLRVSEWKLQTKGTPFTVFIAVTTMR